MVYADASLTFLSPNLINVLSSYDAESTTLCGLWVLLKSFIHKIITLPIVYIHILCAVVVFFNLFLKVPILREFQDLLDLFKEFFEPNSNILLWLERKIKITFYGTVLNKKTKPVMTIFIFFLK